MGLPISVDVGCESEHLGQAITLLSSQINVANYKLLQLIAEFDLAGGWREGGAMRSCAHWLAANCGMLMGAAREKVRVARCLGRLPEVDKAFAEGLLSYSKVRAITRVATQANEGMMVSIAEEASASHLEKLVGRYQPVEEPYVAEEPAEDGADVGAESPPVLDEGERREQARELYWFQDDDGMWVFHARLPPEQGHLVRRVLETLTRPLQEERQEAWNAEQKARMQQVARNIMRDQRVVVADEEPAESTRSGEGQEQGVPAALAYERAGEKISAEMFSQFMNQVRADAFVGMVEHFLAASPGYQGLQGLSGSERCQVVLHVDINTLREQRSGVCCVHGRAHYEDTPWLAPPTARRLACDASLVTVLEDEKGEVLNVGRRSRVVPAHIRRALLERDGVCQYPGCHESRYVDAHHVQHWAEGGETRLDNLVTLCRFHHRQLHRGKFRIEAGKISAEISGGGSGTPFQFILQAEDSATHS